MKEDWFGLYVIYIQVYRLFVTLSSHLVVLQNPIISDPTKSDNKWSGLLGNMLDEAIQLELNSNFAKIEVGLLSINSRNCLSPKHRSQIRTRTSVA